MQHETTLLIKYKKQEKRASVSLNTYLSNDFIQNQLASSRVAVNEKQ